MREIPKPYEIYRHFKGGLYQVIALAKDADDGSTVVVYQALYGDYTVYTRRLAEFISLVDKVKYPQVELVWRFTKVEKEELQAATDELAEANGEATAKQDDVPVATEAASPLHPLVAQFLDLDRISDKLDLIRLHQEELTVDMLTVMMISIGGEAPEGDEPTLYEALKHALRLKEKFEKTRGF